MPIIQFVLPSKSKQIKKLLQYVAAIANALAAVDAAASPNACSGSLTHGSCCVCV